MNEVFRLIVFCVLGSILGYGIWLGLIVLSVGVVGPDEYLRQEMAKQTFWIDDDLLRAWTLGMLVGAGYALRPSRKD